MRLEADRSGARSHLLLCLLGDHDCHVGDLVPARAPDHQAARQGEATAGCGRRVGVVRRCGHDSGERAECAHRGREHRHECYACLWQSSQRTKLKWWLLVLLEEKKKQNIFTILNIYSRNMNKMNEFELAWNVFQFKQRQNNRIQE